MDLFCTEKVKTYLRSEDPYFAEFPTVRLQKYIELRRVVQGKSLVINQYYVRHGILYMIRILETVTSSYE